MERVDERGFVVRTDREGWLSNIFASLLGTPALPPTRHVEITVRLASAGYSFTPLCAEVVVEAAIRANWDPDTMPLRNIVEELARPELNPRTLYGVLGRSIALLWGSQNLEGQAIRVTVCLLEWLSSRPGAIRRLRAIEGNLEWFFGIDVIGWVAARQTFQAWRVGFGQIVVS